MTFQHVTPLAQRERQIMDITHDLSKRYTCHRLIVNVCIVWMGVSVLCKANKIQTNPDGLEQWKIAEQLPK